jgi:hypothetical protein
MRLPVQVQNCMKNKPVRYTKVLGFHISCPGCGQVYTHCSDVHIGVLFLLSSAAIVTDSFSFSFHLYDFINGHEQLIVFFGRSRTAI